jgi:hypothetical protein
LAHNPNGPKVRLRRYFPESLGNGHQRHILLPQAGEPSFLDFIVSWVFRVNLFSSQAARLSHGMMTFR